MLDHEGKEVPGNRGYKYFGAAKDLPGVRELFEKERKCFVPWNLKVVTKMLKPPVDLYLHCYLSRTDIRAVCSNPELLALVVKAPLAVCIERALVICSDGVIAQVLHLIYKNNIGVWGFSPHFIHLSEAFISNILLNQNYIWMSKFHFMAKFPHFISIHSVVSK